MKNRLILFCNFFPSFIDLFDEIKKLYYVESLLYFLVFICDECDGKNVHSLGKHCIAPGCN